MHVLILWANLCQCHFQILGIDSKPCALFRSCSFSFFLRFVVCSLSSELDLIKSKHMKLLNLKIRLLELIKKCIRICQMACSIPLNIRMIPYNYYVVYILDILSFVLPQTVLSAHMLVLEIVVVICKYFD